MDVLKVQDHYGETFREEEPNLNEEENNENQNEEDEGGVAFIEVEMAV